jgi:predicted ArsR family transcriptional regulator
MREPVDERFLKSTRGRIVAALRAGPATVEALAGAVQLTANAVRLHLATLERDGFVVRAGVEPVGPAGGKPAHRYALADDADARLSRAYAPALDALLTELAARHPPATRDAIARGALTRLSTAAPAPGEPLEARVRRAAELLHSLGGATVVERRARGTAFALQGQGCPLGAVTGAHPEVCEGMRALVERVTGAPVRAQCDRPEGGRPSCRFVVGSTR